MHAKSPTSSAIDRKIDIRLTPRSVAPDVLLALQALGYTFREDLDKRDPDAQNSGIWIVDRARLEDVLLRAATGDLAGALPGALPADAAAGGS